MMYGSITSMAQSYVSSLKNFEIRCDAAQDHANHHHVNIEEVAAFQEKNSVSRVTISAFNFSFAGN